MEKNNINYGVGGINSEFVAANALVTWSLPGRKAGAPRWNFLACISVFISGKEDQR